MQRRMPAIAMLAASGCGDPPPRPTFTAVTFNTGTNPGMDHDGLPDDGYTQEHTDRSDLYYGDGLAWLPAIEATRAFLAAVAPDGVVYQEIFDPAACPAIPADARTDFICETWSPGAPTVAQIARMRRLRTAISSTSITCSPTSSPARAGSRAPTDGRP